MTIIKILSNEIQLLLLLIMTITTNNITNIHTLLNSAKLRVVCLSAVVVALNSNFFLSNNID